MQQTVIIIQPVATVSVFQGCLQLDHVVQLLVVVYSLSGDRMPPAPPLYSADEADIKEALADAVMAAAQQQQHPANDGALNLQIDCLPALLQLLQEVSAVVSFSMLLRLCIVTFHVTTGQLLHTGTAAAYCTCSLVGRC